MRSIPLAAALLFIGGCVLVLTACGDSTPLPTANSDAPAYVPSAGAFAEIHSAQAQKPARASTDCNLDAVNGASVGSTPLAHAGAARFAGWAADVADGTGRVPWQVQIFLLGTRDYAVSATTGAPRNDVVKATHQTGLSNAGFEVNADLSAVAPGVYRLALTYQVAGQSLKCDVKQSLTVR